MSETCGMYAKECFVSASIFLFNLLVQERRLFNCEFEKSQYLNRKYDITFIVSQIVNFQVDRMSKRDLIGSRLNKSSFMKEIMFTLEIVEFSLLEYLQFSTLMKAHLTSMCLDASLSYVHDFFSLNNNK